jgi:hypothetical protein
MPPSYLEPDGHSRSPPVVNFANYHPDMIRALSIAWVALAMAFTGGAAAGVASAEPPPPCGFTLSPPEVVQVNGASMVTATVAPDVCIVPPAGPSLNVACLQLLGVDTGGTCAQSRGTDTAQVYVPYRPGTYAARGRGCPSWIGQANGAPICQLLGPVNAPL